MKAIILKEFGEADVLKFNDAPEPSLRPDDLLVKIHAAGVNRADIIQRKGGAGKATYGDSDLMGLEIAGVITAVGTHTKGFKIGDRVMGIVGGGGYAELARINYKMAIPIPEGIDFIQAAAIPEVFVTAHEALFHLGRLQSGNSVLIHAAASGVGTAAVQLAHLAGAKVFVTTRAEKLGTVLTLGANVGIDYRSQDFAEVVMQETRDLGVDVIVDFIGAPYFEKNLRSLSAGGRLVQVGLLGGSKASIPLDRVLYQHLQIIGTVMKSRTLEEKQAMVSRFRDQWLSYFKQGKLKPVVDKVFPLEKAADAHRYMESASNIGKIVLAVGLPIFGT